MNPTTVALAVLLAAALLLLAWAVLDEPAVQAATAALIMLALFGRPTRRHRAPRRHAGRHAGTPARYAGRHWALAVATA